MIKLTNVCKNYNKEVILSNLTTSIEKNEFVCIMGESGAGKTTLLNIIGLLDKPDSGKVSINNKSQFSSKEILNLRRTFFGYIFQDYLLMNNKTIKENLEISFKIYKYRNNIPYAEEIYNALEMVGLNSSFLNKMTYELSGGEQQKVAIARMLLKPYELVLADEPTGNLDYKNKMNIINIFTHIKESGKTIICATHDDDVANSADRILYLKRT